MSKIDITNGTNNSRQMPAIKTRTKSLGMPEFKSASSVHHVGDSIKFTKIVTEQKTETPNNIEIDRVTEIFEEEIPTETHDSFIDEKTENNKENNAVDVFDLELTENKEEMKQPIKKSDKKKKLGKGIKIISILFFLIYLVSTITLMLKIVPTEIIPTKYLTPCIIALSVLLLFFASVTFVNKFKKASKIVSIIFEILISAIFIYASFALSEVMSFLNGIQSSNYQIEEFYIIVKTESGFEEISDLANKTLATYTDTSEAYEQALAEFNQKIKTTQNSYNDFIDASTALMENSVDSLLLKGSLKDTAEEIINDFNDQNIKIIDTIEIKTESNIESAPEIDISNEPFNIFISGIDTYGEIATVSRSDVNMIATVNPKTNTILLTSIPRDYYVQLHNTTGLKDKLTHAGIYGVDMSRQTLEDLFGIEINYYVRVNFSTLLQVIDSIGGIDITPDTTFTAWTDNECTFYANQTMHLNGKCALAYARERHAYASGDRHRIQNQQDVLTAVINKATSSKTLILKYSELLNSLGSSIQTNIPTSQIYKLVNHQLDTMPSWTIDRISVDGTGSMDYTYSIPSQSLYVMIPNQSTVDAATEKINRTMYPENYAETTEEETTSE